MDREQIISDFIELLENQASDEDRSEIISQVSRFVCFYCGVYGEGRCYCTSDD